MEKVILFPPEVYIERRGRLKQDIGSGLLLFPGHGESPINYPDNHYPFRQDSSFLYFWGLDLPGLAAVIDIDEDREVIFGQESTTDDIVWAGPGPGIAKSAHRAGVAETAPSAALESVLAQAQQTGRTIHWLPQYRPENILTMQRLLGLNSPSVATDWSPALVRAVVAQRSIKSEAEIAQIEAAIAISCDMHRLAMQMTEPGLRERDIVGATAGLAYARNGCGLAFPTIFTVNGHILHNPHHHHVMQAGDLVIHDSGAESVMHYSSDITRTFPVDGRFTERQKEIYAIVLDAQEKAIDAAAPGMEFRKVHAIACCRLAAGLKELGMLTGDLNEAVAAGAHTLFFPCGVGHMLGLDVHDMEGLGEDFVGYTDSISRDPRFGFSRLRLARSLEPGFVVTIEPGLYFIPELIDQWRADRRLEPFINYRKVDAYRDFGGIRIEDDVLVTADGRRVLGEPIPKAIGDVEGAWAERRATR
jgi:Xaa-Pro aminopeptidase